MVTIKEIAKMAGVSPSTVSRVISDDPRISIETKQKVKKFMEEMNYHPNAIARSLVSRSTNTIAIVMPYSADEAFMNPFFPEALRGIIKCTYNAGYCVLITNGVTQDEQIESLYSLVRGGRVDGIILMYSKKDDPILKELKKMSIAFSMIGRPVENNNVSYVDNDNVKASYEATKYLIENGHERIGLINGSLNLTVSMDRFEGYKRALLEKGIEIDSSIITSSDFVQEGGYDGMKQMLKSEIMPTAVLVTDDVMAFGAIRATREKGLAIPNDLSIVSFNNIPLSEFSVPPLTSIEINAYDLGFYAADMLLGDIKDKTGYQCRIVDTNMIHRNSVCKVLKKE